MIAQVNKHKVASKQIAEAWLIASGVDPERLVAQGYGESKPIQPNTTEAGQAANRRVQFVILAQQPPEKKR